MGQLRALAQYFAKILAEIEPWRGLRTGERKIPDCCTSLKLRDSKKKFHIKKKTLKKHAAALLGHTVMK